MLLEQPTLKKHEPSTQSDHIRSHHATGPDCSRNNLRLLDIVTMSMMAANQDCRDIFNFHTPQNRVLGVDNSTLNQYSGNRDHAVLHLAVGQQRTPHLAHDIGANVSWKGRKPKSSSVSERIMWLFYKEGLLLAASRVSDQQRVALWYPHGAISNLLGSNEWGCSLVFWQSRIWAVGCYLETIDWRHKVATWTSAAVNKDSNSDVLVHDVIKTRPTLRERTQPW